MNELNLQYRTPFAFLLGCFFCALLAASCSPSGHRADSPAVLHKMLEKAQPGDTITLANGTWQDAVVHFTAQGTAEQPIVIQAESPGEVILSGQSKLYLSGSFGVVSGIWFKAGSSPDGPVMSYESEDGKTKADHCRITDCAITDFSQAERLESDHWVEMHGKHNRFDHNYIGNKQNLGTTLVVQLNQETSLENHNSIDHNYFGPRDRMGSNGGETMRVGTSAFSLSSSRTVIKQNYFERCNGEVEIVSIKASDNLIEGNVFDACEGVLTMRHGNRNVIRGNYFLGRNKPFTGGIRVINAGHTIENNYLHGLQGGRFHAALPVMNGVPNSPINRYHQVKDVTIQNNVLINCREVAFGTGSDNERTATPIQSSFSGNTVYTTDQSWKIKALDDTSGIQFSNNQTNIAADALPGFRQANLQLYQTEEGLEAIEGLPAPTLPIQPQLAGPAWFHQRSKDPKNTAAPKAIELNADNQDQLAELLQKMSPGDTLWVAAGVYTPKKPLTLNQDIHILGRAGYPRFEPGVSLKNKGLFEIHDGAQVHVTGIHFSGRSEHGDASYGIASIGPMLDHYGLQVDDCRFSDFNESRFAGIHAGASTFADSVTVSNCWFKGFSGHGIEFAAEKDDRGRYNVENIRIEDCVFANVMGMAINVYRGGNDESTLGPFAWVTGCTFLNVNNKELGSVVRLLGVQYARLNNCAFANSGASGRCIFFEDPAWADIVIEDCNMHASGRIQTFYDHRVKSGTMTRNPFQVNEEELANWNLQLTPN